MRKIVLPLLLVLASAMNAPSQSGRRIRTLRQAGPIQPPLNPEPEPKVTAAPSPLLFLPASLRERLIYALDNSSFRFQDFSGKVVVINIWASWCGPCRREVPEYEKVRIAYAGRDVEFIGLTAEDPLLSAGRVKKFAREVRFGFRLGWADPATARYLMNGDTAVPQTLVIDAEGSVVDHWSGYMPGHSAEKLKFTIEQALERM